MEEYTDTRRLDLDSTLQRLAVLLRASIGFCAHNTTTPVPIGLGVLLCVSLLDRADELGELRLVFSAHFGKGEDSGGLLVHYSSEPSFTFNDLEEMSVFRYRPLRLVQTHSVWNSHLAAEGWEVDNEFNRVNIVGDEDEGGFLVLDEADDMVEAVLDGVWLLGRILSLLALGDGGGLFLETLLLLCLCLGSVLVEEFEGLGGLITVEDILELGNRWGNLQSPTRC
jgi:hypothetical protein